MNRWSRHAWLVLVLLAASGTCAGAAVSASSSGGWTLADLGTPPEHRDAQVIPVAINDSAEVIVRLNWGRVTALKQGAYLWRKGKWTPLSYGKSLVDLAAMNNRGDAVGQARLSSRSSVAALWRNAKPTILGTLGGPSSQALAINDRDQVIGVSATPTAGRHAFIWQNGRMIDLGTLGGTYAAPTAINNRGQVIGESTTADGATHAFVWQNGTITDLGSVNGNTSFPLAINDAGEIVGDIESPRPHDFPLEAVVWKDGKLIELGSFGAAGARAVAVNKQGDILVELVDSSGDAAGAVLLRDGRPTPIPALGGSPPPDQGGPLVVTGLNDRGQVAGYGYTMTGAGRRSFIWQDGHMTVLPTKDGIHPPWGGPSRLNNKGDLIGMAWVATRAPTGRTPHGVIWRPRAGT